MKTCIKTIGLCALLSLCAATLNAKSIDTNSIKLDFTGYKTDQMADVEGEFNDIKFVLSKDSKTITSALTNAKATIKPFSSNISDIEDASNNVNKVFFPALMGANKTIEARVIKVTEGEDVGLLSVKVSIGKESCIMPMKYTIKDSKFVANGTLDLNCFANGSKALKALSNAAAGHGGISWANVDIRVHADVVK